METLDLFDSQKPVNKLEQRFLVWREVNGDVMKIIEKTALRMLARKRRFSIDAVVHHVRFNEFFAGYRDEPYRINNNHVAYIARELLVSYPEIEPFITIRIVQGECEANESMETGEEL